MFPLAILSTSKTSSSFVCIETYLCNTDSRLELTRTSLHWLLDNVPYVLLMVIFMDSVLENDNLLSCCCRASPKIHNESISWWIDFTHSSNESNLFTEKMIRFCGFSLRVFPNLSPKLSYVVLRQVLGCAQFLKCLYWGHMQSVSQPSL